MGMIAEYPGICSCGCGERIYADVTPIEHDSEGGWKKAGHPIPVKTCEACGMQLLPTGGCPWCD